MLDQQLIIHHGTEKKPEADLRKKSNLFMSIGLMLSLLFINMAFEWKSYDMNKLILPEMLRSEVDELQDISITVHTSPPAPKVTPPEIVEVPDDKIVEKLKFDLDTETTPEDIVADIILKDAPKKEVSDEVHIIVEEQPAPAGKQRGIPVKVRMQLPIFFQLN